MRGLIYLDDVFHSQLDFSDDSALSSRASVGLIEVQLDTVVSPWFRLKNEGLVTYLSLSL